MNLGHLPAARGNQQTQVDYSSKHLKSKNFELQIDVTSEKIHTCPHVIGQNQNTGALKIWHKIVFVLCVENVLKINKFHDLTWISSPRHFSAYTNILKSLRFPNPKHFLSHALLITNMHSVFYLSLNQEVELLQVK